MHGRRLTGIILLVCLLAAPASGDTPQSPEMLRSGEWAAVWTPWKLALVKTATYRTIASMDILVGGFLLTGSEIETATLVAAVAGSKSIVYYLHEFLWASYGPSDEEIHVVNRSLAKAISYRLASMATIFTLSLQFTDSIEISTAAMAIDAVYGTGVYFLHEMLWSHFGPSLRPNRVIP